MPTAVRTIDRAIVEAALKERVKSKAAFQDLKRRVTGLSGGKIPGSASLRRAYEQLIAVHPERRSERFEAILTRRDVRSLSGVSVVTVLTKPYACPGQCVYCPTEAIMPKSYLSNEPAAMRALMMKFDPWRQVETRLEALQENGQPADKIELIVKGGTWSAYAWEYRQWFIKRCFDAANAFGARRGADGKARTNAHGTGRSETLAQAQKTNESARHRLIGITLETRPDWITPIEIQRLRELGCTRIELGVQSVDDRILDLTKRGHDSAATRVASALLRDAGFKTDFHMMPQLPGATPASDLAEMREIFDNPAYRPDMIKIYPCVTVELAELHAWWKDGRYVPYSDAELLEMIIAAKQAVPRYCRISRLIRDIPSTSIVAGNMVTNLRQTAQQEMARRGLHCACLRCREIGRAALAEPALAKLKPRLFDDEYEASHGTEHFLSYEDAGRRGVFAFCRLRLPPKEPQGRTAEVAALMPEIRGVAFIRELHVYGTQVRIGARSTKDAQHKGLGRALMTRAEDIARRAGYGRIAVISGVGVRGYYRKLGYRLQGTYMVKTLA
ncbi:MAG: hypothetical protein RLZZ324_880 [Candidatus Parcubacteria bacterium]|jgi:elongator complex protein 3